MCTDSSSATSSKTKNQKKRARKKIKKVEEGGASAGGEKEELGVSEVGSVGSAEERVVVCDPIADLKAKLEEAKANKVSYAPYFCHSMVLYGPILVVASVFFCHQDHVGAQKLREELWKIRDKATDSGYIVDLHNCVLILHLFCTSSRYTVQAPASSVAPQDEPQMVWPVQVTTQGKGKTNN